MDEAEVQLVFGATYRLLDGCEQVRRDAVCEALGRADGDERTLRALAHLYDNGYISGTTIEESPAPIHIQATEKGLKKAHG